MEAFDCPTLRQRRRSPTLHMHSYWCFIFSSCSLVRCLASSGTFGLLSEALYPPALSQSYQLSKNEERGVRAGKIHTLLGFLLVFLALNAVALEPLIEKISQVLLSRVVGAAWVVGAGLVAADDVASVGNVSGSGSGR